MSSFFLFSFPKFKNSLKSELKNLFGKKLLFKDLPESYLIVETQINENIFINKIRKREPVFLHNFYPIYICSKLQELNEVIVKNLSNRLKTLLNKKTSFKIECITYKSLIKSRDFEVKIGTQLEKEGYKVNFSNPHLIIVACIVENRAYIGVIKSKDVLFPYFNFPLQQSKINNKVKNKLNRSELKLKEALIKFKLDRKVKDKFALDLGAAPGGWSKVLLDMGYKVIAVDKGVLAKEIQKNKRLYHIQENIEKNNIQSIKKLIKDILKKKKIKIITCDINDLPEKICLIINGLLDLLEKNGYVLMTLKGLKNIYQSISFALDFFKEKFEIIKIKHLQFNRKEVTLLMKNKKWRF